MKIREQEREREQYHSVLTQWRATLVIKNKRERDVNSADLTPRETRKSDRGCAHASQCGCTSDWPNLI